MRPSAGGGGLHGREGVAAAAWGFLHTALGSGLLAGLVLGGLAPAQALANPLERDLGRNETRVLSDVFPLRRDADPVADHVPERLDQLGYRRVRGRRPERPGLYFWGTERFWIHRRGHHRHGRWVEPRLLELRLDARGRVAGVHDAEGAVVDESDAYLEPLLLSESLTHRRAHRSGVPLDELPEHLWRSLLAAEDARFFEHGGVDSRSVARALLANLREGGVAQGGSTITQQLVKGRDLSPRRTIGRKVSEALRALALEAEVEKRDILENYLDTVYFGHVRGVEIHGVEAAARVFFSRSARELDLAQSALLAGIVQSPNGLSPVRNPERALERRRYVLRRLEELGWADPQELDRIAAARDPGLRLEAPDPSMAPSLQTALRVAIGERLRQRLGEGRGLIVETHLDPWLQTQAESALRSARGSGVEGAAVVGDLRTGGLVAYVATTGRVGGELDRVRSARRQPGSTVKPFVVLEALDRCGRERSLTLATRVADRPLTVDLPSGPWSPRNDDGHWRGVVDVRQALVSSLNVPTVRVARHCGFDRVARTFRELGIDGVREEQPAFVLGAVETTPLELLEAYARLGPLRSPRIPHLLIDRVLSPDGDVLLRRRGRRDRSPSDPSAEVAWLVRDALSDAAGASGVGVEGAWGKTGTSSGRRDAWFAGGLGDLVGVVWLGRDDGAPAGVSGAEDAAPIWRSILRSTRGIAGMESSLEAERRARERLLSHPVDPATGLIRARARAGDEVEWFKRGTVPPKRRWWRPGADSGVIE